MTQHRTAGFVSISLMAASLILVVPRAVFALDAEDLPAAIENAKTAADHEAIAAYYDAEAKAASATAEEHRRMAAAYGKRPKAAGTKGNRSTVYRTIRPHCEKLVASYEASARDYAAMATSHREAATALR
jgi:hypothetical protein